MDTGAPLQFDARPVDTPEGGPLAVELIPAPDPWAVARKLAHLPHLLFLDSAEKHADRGRYSYVSADPVRFYSQNGGIRLPNTGRWKAWNILDDLVRGTWKSGTQSVPKLPPFQGGIAGL